MFAGQLALLLLVVQIISNENCSASVRGGRGKTSRRQNFPDGYVLFRNFGVAYKLYEKSELWHNAQKNCCDEDGYLAIADTWPKLNAIAGLRGSSKSWIHVGFIWSDKDVVWLRMDNDGPVEKRLPWSQRKPSGAGKCAGIDYDEHETDKAGLIDYDCDTTRHYYACEIPLPV